MKRIFALLFSTMLVWQAQGQLNFDFSAVHSNGQVLYYKITSDSTVEVTCPYYYNGDYYSGYNKPSGEIIVPETVIHSGTDYTVTRIDNSAFYNCSNLTSVTIPNSVTCISDYAFYGCNGLTSVTIPNSVTNIGWNVFNGCSSLESLTLPFIGGNDTDTQPLGYIFGNSVSNDIPSTLKSVTITGGSHIPYGAFYNCVNLTSITISGAVTDIGGNAFYNCNNLVSVSIPNSVTSIGHNAFENCGNLNLNMYDNAYYIGNDKNPYVVLFRAKRSTITSCNIHNNCNLICYKAFYQCKDMSSITIPDSVVSIGDYAFCNCDGLTSIIIPNSVISIGESALDYCRSLATVTLGNSVADIGSYAFHFCINLSTINFGNSLKNIGKSAFGYCSSLTLVDMPKSVISIGNNAFNECNNLTTVNIPNSVTSIGSEAFYKCTSLRTIVIPESVTSIGSDAFSGFSNIDYVVSKASTPPTLDGDAFASIDTIHVPIDYIDDYKAAPIWKWKVILPFYSLQAKTNNKTAGLVTVSDSVLFDGYDITITATPNDGYHFVKWSDGNIDNPRSYSTASDTSFSAIFEAHTVVIDTAVSATCTATGKTEGSHCSVCGTILVAQTETPMVEHTVVTDTAVAATATTDGLTEGSHCSVCGKVIVAQMVIPALGEQDNGNGNQGETNEGGENNQEGNENQGGENQNGDEGNQGGNNEGGNENQGGNGNNPVTAIAGDAVNAVNIYATGNTIIIENATEEIYVYNAMGALVGRDVARNVSTIRINNSGVYIVKTGNVLKRVMVN